MLVSAIQLLHNVAPVLAEASTLVIKQNPPLKTANFLKCLRLDLWFIERTCVQIIQSQQEADLSVDLLPDQCKRLLGLDNILNPVILPEPGEDPTGIRQDPNGMTFAPGLDRLQNLKSLFLITTRLSPIEKATYFGTPILNLGLSEQSLQKTLDALVLTKDDLGALAVKLPRKPPYPNTWGEENSTSISRFLDDFHKELSCTWPICRHRHDEHNPKTLFHTSYILLRANGLWASSFEAEQNLNVLFQTAEGLQEVHVHPGTSREAVHDPHNTQSLCLRLVDGQKLVQVELHNGVIKNVKPVLADKAWHNTVHWTLDTIIHHYPLDYTERSMLCLVLARSMLDLLQTMWINDRDFFGLSSIVVFQFRQPRNRLDLREPYLVFHTPEHRLECPAESLAPKSGRFELHPIPQLLGLGIAIMQIFLGQQLTPTNPINNETSEGTMIRVGNELRKACASRFPRTWKPLTPLSRIIDCQWGGWLPETTEQKASDESTTRIPRAIISRVYKEIVRPLEHAIIEEAGISVKDNGSHVKELLSEPAAEVDDLLVAASLDPIQGNSLGTFPNERQLLGNIDNTPSRQAAKQSDEWIKDMKTINAKLQGLSMKHQTPQQVQWNGLIKVAILDTGCDLSYGNAANYNRISQPHGMNPGIVAWQDFLSEDPSATCVDESDSKHGSFMTHLLLRATGGMVKIYIGRVLREDTTSDPAIPGRLAKAIVKATDEWEVDIISISLDINDSGNEEDLKPIKLAVEIASKKALIFACAGNHRGPGDKPVALPGGYSDHVLCIFSHKSDATPLGNIAHARSGHANFTVIGENLKRPEKPGSAVRLYDSGTSSSTILAAAIAVIVLGFSQRFKGQAMEMIWSQPRSVRHPGQRDMLPTAIVEVNPLKNTQVMKQIFFRLMNHNEPTLGAYNAVNPSRLFTEEDLNDQELGLTRIASRIMHILNGVRGDRLSLIL